MNMYMQFMFLFRNEERRGSRTRVVVNPRDSASSIRATKLCVKSSTGTTSRAIVKRFVQ